METPMSINVKDIAEGKGPEYILLAKWNGKYTIFSTGEKLQEIIDRVEQLKENVKLKSINKNDISKV
jgi:archaellum component FlaG (FlaF/FlaG flagellin family)